MPESKSMQPSEADGTGPASASRPSLVMYQAFLDDCPEPMQITDPEGNVVAVNQALLDGIGLPREAVIGSNHLKSGYYVDIGQRDGLFAQLKANGRVTDYKVRLRTPAMGEFAAVVSASLVVIEGRPLVLSTIRSLSEMEAAQEALRKSEELLRSAFQASLDPITLSKTDGEFVEVNDAFCEASGYTREETLGRTGMTMRLWRDNAQRDAFFAALAAQGSVRAFAADMLDRWGNVRPCLVSARITVVGGVPLVLSVTKDITRLVLAEETLRKSEEFFRTLVHDGVDPVALAEPDGKLAEVNDAFVELTGYSRVELIGKNATQLGLWHDHSQRDELSRMLLQHGVFRNYPLTVRRKDGALRHCLIAARRLTIGGREMLYSSTKDVTELRQAEDALRASEERFRFILNDVSQIAIQGYDENREVIFWNEASERLYGYAEQEALGRRLEDLIIPDGIRQDVVNAINNWLVRGVRIPAGELTLRAKDGRPVPVYSSHVMFQPRAGLREMYCIDLDMTDFRRMQAEHVEAKERAEAADKAKSEFLANMSHEIRTPLNGILGMLQLMQLDNTPEEQAAYVTKAVSAGHRLLSLLNDVLDFSKMDAGQTRLKISSFNLPQLFDSVAAIFQVACAAKRITLSFGADQSVPDELLGDEARLRQILFNLVGNAVKFTHAGEVRVEAWARPDTRHGPGGVRLHLAVRDTGIGMPEDKISHMFRRFTQNDGTMTREYEGAGLGLAIVKRIVSLMRGSIDVESEVGKGTTMHLHVLLATPQPELASGSVPASPEAEAVVRPLRILLAEDDVTSQLAMRVMLTRMGHHVVCVDNGRRAVDALLAGDFDCVFMDIQMPEMNGVDATRIIRTAPELTTKAGIPVIALTAYAMSGDRERFLAAGLDGHLPKPVDRLELERALARVAGTEIVVRPARP